MKKLTRVHPLMSEAFIIWLVRIGYRGVRHSSGDTHFYCEVVNKNFPRGVVIMANGKLNKIAVRLYEEFKGHDPFNEVA